MKSIVITPASHVAFLRSQRRGRRYRVHRFLFAVVRSCLPKSFPERSGRLEMTPSVPESVFVIYLVQVAELESVSSPEAELWGELWGEFGTCPNSCESRALISGVSALFF